MKKEKIESKKGMSSTVVGVILLIIGLAVMVALIIYFGTAGRGTVSDFMDKIIFIKRGV